MKHSSLFLQRLLVWLAALAVALPLILLVAWSFANRWPAPYLLPQTYTLRGWQRVFSGYFNVGRVAASSIVLSLAVGAAAAVVAAMAARGLCLYPVRAKKVIHGIALLPVIVPATVFGMGSHMLFIQMGLNNTLAAVAFCHLISALPFALHIMLETTQLAGSRLEEQARVLGASPLAGFFHGTLPAIAPGLVSAWAASFLFSYTQYFLTLLMGGGKVQTLATLVMPLIEGADATIASAYSFLFIASALLVFGVLQGVSALVARTVGKQLGGTA